ncbi:MAG: metal-dependent hydrolase [Pseudomonadota bacterium]|nr:metal-dependent hydrolase [Pseudomonadota bacterium]
MKKEASPIRRDMKFKVDPSKVMNWVGDDPFTNYLLNVGSMSFPKGERFFIDTMRAHSEFVADDPKLKKDMSAFIGQEAMHGREHDIYNEAHEIQNPKAAAFQHKTTDLMINTIKRFPRRYWLLSSAALEHLTAIFGGAYLEMHDTITPDDRCDPDYKAMWMWHALEETEHKAVVFDVYQKAYGDDSKLSNYLLRCFFLITSTILYMGSLFSSLFYLIYTRGELTDRKAWGKFYLGALKPIIVRISGDWLDWFKRGFHPWEHDNIIKLKEFEDYLGGVPSPFTIEPPTAQ